MIQVYLPGNKNFESNGDMTLMPTSCTVSCEINGVWELSMTHPVDSEGRWKYIQTDGVLKVPLFDSEQLYTIDAFDLNETEITLTAKPIFMRARDDCLLVDVRPTDKNGQQALDIMMQGSAYKGSSNITKAATAYYVRKNLIEAIAGDDENSFINRWGGEIWYDNMTVIINDRLGIDRGALIKYGRNIPSDGLTESVDTADVVTRVYPVAYNGRMISETNKYVDSPLISRYPTVRGRFIQYEHVKLKADATYENDGDIICNTQAELDVKLKELAALEFSQGNIDKPKVTISADMVLLENTTLYDDVKSLEAVHLGDDVLCEHSKLGISTTARVVACVYDCLRQKTQSVTIGETEYDYFKESAGMASKVTEMYGSFDGLVNGPIMAERVAGVLNMLNVSLRAQKDAAQKQDVRAILFEDIDPASPTFGALCIGTQGIQIAKKRNTQNTDWDWGTAIDFQSIYANMIIAGILSDKLGNFYLDLDSGELRMKNGTFTGNVTGATITGGTITGTTIKGGSINISDVFTVDSTGEVTISKGSFNIVGETKTLTFAAGDPQKVEDYIMGKITLTPEEIKKYDVNGDGRVSPADYVMIRYIVQYGGSAVKTKNFSLNAGGSPTLNFNSQTTYANGKVASSVTSLGADGLVASSAEIDSILTCGSLQSSGSISGHQTFALYNDSASILLQTQHQPVDGFSLFLDNGIAANSGDRIYTGFRISKNEGVYFINDHENGDFKQFLNSGKTQTFLRTASPVSFGSSWKGGVKSSSPVTGLAGASAFFVEVAFNGNYSYGWAMPGKYAYIATESDSGGLYVRIDADGNVNLSTYKYDGTSYLNKVYPVYF